MQPTRPPTLHEAGGIDNCVAWVASPKTPRADVLEPRTCVHDFNHLGAGIEQMKLAAVDATDRTRFANVEKETFESIEFEPQRFDGGFNRRRSAVSCTCTLAIVPMLRACG